MKYFFAFCFFILLSVPVFAQDATTILEDERIRWNLAAAQIEASLDSEYEFVREQTLKNAIIIVTLYRDKIDLANQESLLNKIYAESESEEHRNLALALLQTIGGERAQDYMNHEATQAEANQVRSVLATVLKDYLESCEVRSDWPAYERQDDGDQVKFKMATWRIFSCS